VSQDNITLTLPAVPDFVRLARLTVASLATKVGFSYDEVEDLRIAVGEACALLIEPTGRKGSITLVFDPSPKGLEVEVEGTFDDPPGEGEGADLSAQILDAVVDWYEFSAEDGKVRLSKAVGST
jgi:serine/threonine-protein kinase RsbW